MFLATLALAAGWLGWFEVQSYSLARTAALRGVAERAATIAAHTGRLLAVADLALATGITTYVDDQRHLPRDAARVDSQLRSLDAALPMVRGLVIIDRDGWSRFDTAADFGAPPLRLGDRDYVRHFTENGGALDQPYVGRPVQGRRTGDWFLSLARAFPAPPNSGATVGGVGLAVLDIQFLRRSHAALLPRDGSVMALVTDKGVVVHALMGLSIPESLSGDALDTIAAFASTGDPTVAGLRDDPDYALVVEPVEGLPLSVVVARPWTLTLESWRHNLVRDGGILLVATLLLAGAWVPVTRALRDRDRVFDLSRDPVAVIDTDGHVLRINHAWEQVLGYRQSRLTGRALTETIHPADREMARRALMKLATGEALEDLSVRHVARDGSVVWLGWSAVAEGGRVFAIGRNITRRREIEDALRASELRFRAVVEASGEFVWEVDADGRLTFLSERARAVLGRRPAEMLGHRLTDLLTPDSARWVERAILRGLSFGVEVEAVRVGGGVVWLRLAGQPAVGPGGQVVGFRGVGLDTTESKQARQALLDSEARYRNIINTVVDGIVTIDENGIIQSVNPAVERIFGHAARSMVGRNVNMLMDEPDRSAHDSYLARYRRDGAPRAIGRGREVTALRKNGERFPLELGISEVWLGSQRFFLGVCRDISDRKRIDLLKDEFVSTVSHELRTPLTSIRGSLGLILGGAAGTLPDKAERLVMIAHNNSQRLINLVNDILDIQRIESGRMVFEMKPTALGEVVRHAVDEIGPFATSYRVTVGVEDAGGDTRVNGDAGRLQQVMINLLSNAVKFSPAGGVVRVYVQNQGNRVRVAVSDQGPGIPDSFRMRIFQRFSQVDATDSRTKGGTGLGLSIVKAIVEHHAGTITYHSEAGRGTTFLVDLPRLGTPRQPAGSALDHADIALPAAAIGGPAPSPPRGPVSPPTRRGRVLVVESDSELSALLVATLEALGEARAVASLAAAGAFLADGPPVDVVVIDSHLPDGVAADLLPVLAQQPGAPPLILLSAVRTAGPLADGFAACLEKARLDSHDLLAVVARVAGLAEPGDPVTVQDLPASPPP